MKETMNLQPRTTIYKGIKMRSRLEARVAATFDRAGLVWEYEPQCFADETGQYLPDFYIPVRPDVNEDVWIEVKTSGPLFPPGVTTFDEMLGAWFEKMKIIRSSIPDAWLVLLYAVDDELLSWCSSPEETEGWGGVSPKIIMVPL